MIYYEHIFIFQYFESKYVHGQISNSNCYYISSNGEAFPKSSQQQPFIEKNLRTKD